MTGHVLIVDALVTNRIILKSQLTAAYYVVSQAGTAQEATRVCLQDPPDLLIIGNLLPDMDPGDLIRRLERVCPHPAPPVLMILSQLDEEARFAALLSGAADVLTHPFHEEELFARLRALLRQRRLDCDLAMHVNTASALGFADDPLGFSGPEWALILSSNQVRAERIRQRIRPFCRYEVATGAYTEALTLSEAMPRPDVALLHIGPEQEINGLRSLAELQAGPVSRDMRLIALIEGDMAQNTSKLLDMGACDVVSYAGQDRELAFRMTLNMARKKRSDALRGQLENGLQAAVLDPLTGIHNRRFAQVFLNRMIDQAEADGSSFAVMIADLDHFKAVNDTYGHAVGDRVLAGSAAVMKEVLPAGAMIARLGGEEFLIAVPDTSLADVRALAWWLGQTVREMSVDLKESCDPLRVTVSIGATLVHPARRREGLNAEALIDQADKALYNSKSGGRDTITVTVKMRSAA